VDEWESRVALLQERIRQQHDRLGRLDPDDEGYLDAARATLETTFELIEYEERVPLLRDAPRRAASLRTVRGCGWAAVGLAVVTALGVPPGWVSRWWLLLVGPVLLAGLLLVRLPVPGPGGPHAARADAALVLAAVAVALPALALGLVAAPLAVLVVIALAVAIRALLRVRRD
jgi:hypothetical protein